MQAVFGVKYKGYARVHAPRGSVPLTRQLSSSTSAIDSLGGPEPARLSRMIAMREEEKPTFDTYTYKWCTPAYYGSTSGSTCDLRGHEIVDVSHRSK